MNYKAKTDYSKILMILAIVFMMICGFIVSKRRSYIKEAKRLPFHNVQLETVEDGTYHGECNTSFLHLKLDVTVKDHKLVKIDVTEKSGLDGETALPIIDEMIEQNKTVVPAIKGSELGSLQYISCVDSALYGGK